MGKSPAKEVAALNGDKIIFKNAANGKGFSAGSKIVTQDGLSQTLLVSELVDNSSDLEAQPKPSPAITVEEIQSLIQNAIAPVIEQSSAKDIALNEAQFEAEQLKAEIEALKQAAELAKANASAAIAETTAAAVSAQQSAAAEAAELQSKLEAAQKAETAMAELGKLVGGDVKQFQTIEVLGTGSQELRNWQQMLEQAPGAVVMHSNRQFSQKDTRAASSYLRRNQSKIREGIEAELRNAGFLQGAGALVTNTLISDIPSSSFSYLSEFVRRATDGTLIYSQFARTYAVPGTAPRLQGQVPRYPYSPGPAVIADRILTPGTDIGTDRQIIVEDLVPVTIQELGLGKDANNAPISLTNFVQAFSMENLEAIVARNLGRDYQRTKDLFIRTQYFTANTVVYNNANRVASLPAAVEANGIGHATRGHLRALRAAMSTQQIPAYSNGCYVITLTPNQVQYLLDELATQQRFPEPSSAEIEMITKVLQNEDEDYGGLVNGYRMTLDGFMVFEQNIHSTGAAGTPGAQSEPLGVGATVTETCFAFGADAVCWATALPVEIRQDEITNFGRRDSWIWYSHENAAPLDLNEVVDNGRVTRERRVLQVRYTRDPV